MNTKNDSVSEQHKNLQTAAYILQFSKTSVHFVSTRAHLRASRRDETLTFWGTLTDVSRIWLTFVRCRPAQGPVQNPNMDLFWVFIGAQKATTSCPKRSCTLCLLHTCNFLKTPSTTLVSIIMHNECVPKKHFHVNFLTLEGGTDVISKTKGGRE